MAANDQPNERHAKIVVRRRCRRYPGLLIDSFPPFRSSFPTHRRWLGSILLPASALTFDDRPGDKRLLESSFRLRNTEMARLSPCVTSKVLLHNSKAIRSVGIPACFMNSFLPTDILPLLPPHTHQLEGDIDEERRG
jgi:hypothetical protein